MTAANSIQWSVKTRRNVKAHILVVNGRRHEDFFVLSNSYEGVYVSFGRCFQSLADAKKHVYDLFKMDAIWLD